ncbi:MAG: hypothetical protein CVV22_12270 [Ignavibacteriae bacterium HGW-Ignavibacteriae-1]|jgi:hypothetical protein|nr:MAG: hypothetical protein CVV22_12270 [Ignavibacteriae bacterium HGW-Ignavibacteriae-1]
MVSGLHINLVSILEKMYSLRKVLLNKIFTRLDIPNVQNETKQIIYNGKYNNKLNVAKILYEIL